jgi:hypothetical protein
MVLYSRTVSFKADRIFGSKAYRSIDYHNTIIRLATLDPNFKDYAITENVEVFNMTTSDGGLTWRIECIHVKGIYFQKVV